MNLYHVMTLDIITASGSLFSLNIQMFCVLGWGKAVDVKLMRFKVGLDWEGFPCV